MKGSSKIAALAAMLMAGLATDGSHGGMKVSFSKQSKLRKENIKQRKLKDLKDENKRKVRRRISKESRKINQKFNKAA